MPLLTISRSDLPVIVSLEVHAGPEQQQIMVEIITTAFAGHLLSAPKEGDLSLPNPESLKKKICIKVKYLDPDKAAEKEKATETNNSLNVPSLTKKVSSTSIKSNSSKKSWLSKRKSTASLSSSSSDDEDAPNSEKPKKKSSIIPELSALGVYTRSYHFSDLAHPDALVPTHIFSLSEKKLMEVHESHGPTLFSHNRNYLMRAFPSGLRVRSDNLDPSIFWRKGVQIVALNWQKWDKGMMLNAGMFDGSAGWVLKPQGYLGSNIDTGATTGPKASDIKEIGTESQADAAIQRKTLTFTLTVLAAQNLPLPPSMKSVSSFRPYLKTELHVEKPSERTGAPIPNDGKANTNHNEELKPTSSSPPSREKERAKEKEKDDEEAKFKHSIKPDVKGVRDIDFHATKLEWRDVPGVVEELSFLRVKVMNDEMGKDPLCAWACVRLDRVREGWRFLRLWTAEGERSNGVVLWGVEKSVKSEG